MNGAIVFVVLMVLGAPLALIIWLISCAVSARNRIDELSRRVGGLEVEIYRLKSGLVEPAASSEPAVTAARRFTEALAAEPATVTEPPPIVPEPTPIPAATPIEEQFTAPPPIASAREESPAPPPIPMEPWSGKAAPQINWEQFMGVKLFAWVGGLALFLGIVFFVKYSFEHNLIPPEVRVAIGFAVGLGLLIGGVMLHRRKQYIVGAQALCATGVVTLYAVTFACRSYYNFLNPTAAFLVMILITATAFFVAVRLNALVVAILGMLGGFLTPYLVSTGQDNPLGLFGYIAILDAGLILVALNRRWFFLTALAAAGTVLMQIGWAAEFFLRNKYFEGKNIFIPLIVLLGFNLLYLIANWLSQRREIPVSDSAAVHSPAYWLPGSALGLIAVALVFTFWFLDFPQLAQRPWLMFSFVFLLDAIVGALVVLNQKLSPALSLSGLAVFGLLGFWTQNSLTNELLNAGLVFYLVFAIAHSVVPFLFERRGGVRAAGRAGHLFPIFALILVLLPIFKLAELSFIVWPFILLVDVLAIVLAVLTATLLPVLAVLLLTLGATAALIFKIPPDLTGLPTSFFLLGGFAVFFFAASVWIIRKFSPDAFNSGVRFGEDLTNPADVAAVLPACSAVLPFLLLIMATLRLHLANPSPVFGLALLLVVLILGVTKLFSLEWMPAIGLACVAALECAWHFNRFDFASTNPTPQLVLGWYLIFYAVFALFPFVFLKQFSGRIVPWATAAFAGLPQFFLIYRLVKATWPNDYMGALPAAFSIPALLGLMVLLKKVPVETKSRTSQLAWFGGVALFFITLIFPIQFDRQWITIGWALEGAALLWLFHRVPHPGLRLTGIGLLVAAFVRLTFNSAVLTYHPRSETPIWNWYLYTYGIVTISLFAGAKLLAPPRQTVLKSNAQGILASLGMILAFLLLNIEIADYFSKPGSTLTFEFTGDFARDMTYSIAWALYALILLVYGIARKVPASRYAAIGLLAVTLLKLFFHDLAQLNELFRIGAFVGVAVIVFLASFAYQRFYSTAATQQEKKNEPTQ